MLPLEVLHPGFSGYGYRETETIRPDLYIRYVAARKSLAQPYREDQPDRLKTKRRGYFCPTGGLEGWERMSIPALQSLCPSGWPKLPDRTPPPDRSRASRQNCVAPGLSFLETRRNDPV